MATRDHTQTPLTRRAPSADEPEAAKRRQPPDGVDAPALAAFDRSVPGVEVKRVGIEISFIGLAGDLIAAGAASTGMFPEGRKRSRYSAACLQDDGRETWSVHKLGADFFKVTRYATDEALACIGWHFESARAPRFARVVPEPYSKAGADRYLERLFNLAAVNAQTIDMALKGELWDHGPFKVSDEDYRSIKAQFETLLDSIAQASVQRPAPVLRVVLSEPPQ